MVHWISIQRKRVLARPEGQESRCSLRGFSHRTPAALQATGGKATSAGLLMIPMTTAAKRSSVDRPRSCCTTVDLCTLVLD